MNETALSRALRRLPRVRLGVLPTPLQRAPRLSERLGLDVWLKRDDLLGPAMGGNKTRKLEHLLADARQQGADCVITCGAAQSNHARLTAACARLAGLEPYLVLRSLEPAAPQGNLLLDHLLGAHVQVEPVRRTVDLWPAMEALAERLRGDGRHPYLIPVGGSVPLGAAAYAAALLELDAQAQAAGLEPTTIVHASSSGGTQAGLALGAAALAGIGRAWCVLGVDVDGDPAGLRQTVTSLARATAAHLDLAYVSPAVPDRPPAEPHPLSGEPSRSAAAPAPLANTLDPKPHVHVLDGYAGPGYGQVSEDGREAIRLLAQTEGIFVDPVYSGKALAGLIGEARAGRLPLDRPVVFWHTGGTPAIFAYAAALL